jgi:hypothetical protein
MCKLKPLLVSAALLFLTYPRMVHAQASQFADAMADVVTFGAWGQSRDEHRAEIERLNKLHEEEIIRLQNRTAALVSATRIQDERTAALNARYTGQQLLVIISLIESVISQIKIDVAQRYQINSNVQDFSEWFDSYVQETSNDFGTLVELLKKTTTLDPESLDAVMRTAKLADLERTRQANQARVYLKHAIDSSKWEQLQQAVTTLVDVRRLLVQLFENQRTTLREAVQRMAEEDVSRRHLCDPNPVAITCDPQGNNCKYFQAAGPGPCGDIVYVNWFPVSFVKEIFDNLTSYKANAEFYVDIGRIDEQGPISLSSYRSPTEIFSAELKSKPLIAAAFRQPESCGNFATLRKRLFEAIDYVQIFGKVNGITQTERKRISWLKSQRPYLVFGLNGLEPLMKHKVDCGQLSDSTKQQIDLIRDAVIAVEAFADDLTANLTTAGEAQDLLSPVEKLANEM